MKETLHLQKKPRVADNILLLKEQVRIHKLENKKLQEKIKSQLNVNERLA